MSGQQYMQALQQSPYYQQVQNSPFVMPHQFPIQQSPWGQIKKGFNAPLQSEVMAQQQLAMGKKISDQRAAGAPRQQRN
jgi:hypothetical protein